MTDERIEQIRRSLDSVGISHVPAQPEDTAAYDALDALVADLEAARRERDEAKQEAEDWFAQHQGLARDDYFQLTARENEKLRVERDVAVERARTLERALEVIAAGPDSFQAQSRYTGTVATVNCEWPGIARAALAEETQ